MTNVLRRPSVAGRGIRVIRWLVIINLTLVGLQPISAGLFMSGYARALTIHAGVGLALQLGALVQVGAAVVLWLRRGVPAWVAGVSIALFLIAFVQVGSGFRRVYWLHVPIGVGIVGGLTRQVSRLDSFGRSVAVKS